MPGQPIGISNQIGRFGVRPPNQTAPSGGNMPNPVAAGVDTPWYASGPTWVLIFLVVGYILVFQTLRER